MTSKANPLDSNTFAAYSKQAYSLTSPSKCAIAALALGTVVGVIFVSLGATNLFGSVGSLKSVVSIAGGASLTLIALGGIALIICKCKPREQKKMSETQSVSDHSSIQAGQTKVYFVSDPAYTEHLTGKDHPERPERVTSINRALEQAGLKDKNNSLSPRIATAAELNLCHDVEYIHKVQSEIEQLKPQQMAELSTGDVNISPKSFHAARLAVGGVLTAVDQVFTSEIAKVFCVVRPPGHHASRNRGAGFCIFNNVAIAARYAQQKYGVNRVLIVDWDVHHGDGTQNIFYADPSVFYFSTHEAGNYPHTGAMNETGVDAGKGFTVNIPIPGKAQFKDRQGTGAIVIEAFQRQLKNAMHHFQPEFILISCGFDGHKDDPLGGFDLTNEDYATLTQCINQIANQYAKGRIVSVLEGGYNLKAIAEASVSHVRALTGS